MTTTRDARSGIWLAFESTGGCLVYAEHPVSVHSVEEARCTMVSTAGEVLEERKPACPDPAYFLFPRGGDRGWDDLVRCESYRCYDPSVPEEGMQVSYTLYEEGGLSGVGGVMWTYGVYLTVNGSPEIWDHPAHVPCGLDLFDD